MKKYENFVSALANLEDAPNQDLNNDFVQSGLINKFNLQFELSWKLLKRLLEYEGATLAASGSPRAILKESYRFYDFIDEAAWLDMLRDRNTNVHIYDNKLAQDLIQRILNVYIPAFCQLRDGLMERYGELLMAPDDQFVFEKVIGGIISVNFQQIRKLIVFAFPIMGRTAVKFNPVVEQTVAPAKKGGIIVGKRTEIQHKQ